MENKTRRSYSAEFKRRAVALACQPSQTIQGVTQDLGVGPAWFNAGSVNSGNIRRVSI